MSHTHYKVKEGVLSQQSLWGKMLAGAMALMLVLALVVSLSARAADTTEVVTGNTAPAYNEPGWLFNRDLTNATPIEFNSDQASIGQGSLYVEPLSSDAAKKFIGEYFLKTPVSEVNSISYDFLIGAGGAVSDENEFYMNAYVNFNGNTTEYGDCVYNIVPTIGSTSAWTTVTFDPNSTYSVRDRNPSDANVCPASPSDVEDGYLRMFALNVGDTTANDEGLDGYFDNVVVNALSGTTTFDFEPTLTPENKDDCKNGGWMTFNTPAFNNQGQCVAYVTANENAKFKRQ